MNYRKRCGWLLLTIISMLSACSSSIATQLPPMAMPLQPTAKQEYVIAQLSQIINQKKTNKTTRAEAFFERSNIYDSLGLQEYALVDIQQALELDPKKPYFYNMLGIYLLQRTEYDAAYQYFESAIELDPKDIYAQRNLGIALYYGGREQLATDQLEISYQIDPTDAYSVIWLYLAESAFSPMLAQSELLKNRSQVKDPWGLQIIDFYLGKLDEKSLVEQASNKSETNQKHAEKLTEAYFYIAKRYQQQQNYDIAIRLFKMSLSQNVYYYIEHRYALLELNDIYSKENQTNSVNSATIDNNNETSPH